MTLHILTSLLTLSEDSLITYEVRPYKPDYIVCIVCEQGLDDIDGQTIVTVDPSNLLSWKELLLTDWQNDR